MQVGRFANFKKGGFWNPNFIVADGKVYTIQIVDEDDGALRPTVLEIMGSKVRYHEIK